ncbi:beta-glucosidase [Cladochytrium replicatum]|nr:beta-glucosidase [Cladochytrium replicatum]
MGGPAIQYMKQPDGNGPVLGYTAESGVTLIELDGKLFKNLSKAGELLPYEDWRLSAQDRAVDLASRLSVEEIAGLMLYSNHQAVPAPLGWAPSTYKGLPYEEARKAGQAEPSDLTDQQVEFLSKDHLRHVLVVRVETSAISAEWNNKLQGLAEKSRMGIPVNISTDPRHTAESTKEYSVGSGGDISMWPETLGIAATFDPTVAGKYGSIAAKEYRALGIATSLSPQIDLSTDPRWMRFEGTFGEDTALATDLARAVIDGFQTTLDKDRQTAEGWGYDSVVAMAKHWPGGGSGEAGRDAHFGFGKYAVYPGDRFRQHLLPFTEGAFKLSGPTGCSGAIMPYYTISFDQDTKNHKNVANSYSTYIIQDLLRGEFGYDGVVCTDWAITDDEPDDITKLGPGGRCWGVEEGFSVAERHYMIISAGVDQFGGNNQAGPVMEAYQIGVNRHGEEYMRKKFETSAVRLLRGMFRLGLFENPYLDPIKSQELVGCAEYMEEGYKAQLKSIVLLKNRNNLLPISTSQKGKKVYIPERYRPAHNSWIGEPVPESRKLPMSGEIITKYNLELVTTPEDADFALVCIESPMTTYGYSEYDVISGGTGYIPISLQYRPYTAVKGRSKSMAGDPRSKDVFNRTYLGKTVSVINESDLDAVLETRSKMGTRPVIVTFKLSNPTVVAEFESAADAILVHFGVQEQAIWDTLCGVSEPSGLLPLQMPANMESVEEQMEDVPRDMKPHLDDTGHVYDFGFGLNWGGRIVDYRTNKYASG